MFLTVFLQGPFRINIHSLKWDPIVLIVRRGYLLLFDLNQAGHFASTMAYLHSTHSKRLRD
jgi:hypothetical protein